MIFKPPNMSKTVCDKFSNFVLDGLQVTFASSFRYLGHIVEINLCDNLDINPKIRNLYYRTNVLKQRFTCS